MQQDACNLRCADAACAQYFWQNYSSQILISRDRSLVVRLVVRSRVAAIKFYCIVLRSVEQDETTHVGTALIYSEAINVSR